MTTTRTVQDRFDSAVSAAAGSGVPLRINEDGLCYRSCYVVNDPAEVYTLSQFGEFRFTEDGQTPVYVETLDVECTCEEDEYDDEGDLVREGEMCDACTGRGSDTEENITVVSTMYFYFTRLESAQVFSEAMHAQGFDIEWYGTKASAIGVIF